MKRFFNSYKGVLTLCFVAYCAAYLCRLNINPALPSIQRDLGLTDSQLGAITSAFFWLYAGGQLFNGWLGCRIPARFMVGTGLLGSAACNVVFQLVGDPVAMMAVWGVNGLFQSMLWGPLMKSIANWCEPRNLPSASFAMSISCIVGDALANGFSGFMAVRVSFLIPAVFAALIGLLALLALNGEPHGALLGHDELAGHPAPSAKIEMPLFRFILMSCLPLMLIVAISNGCIKDGFSVWFPKILQDSGLIVPENSWLLLLALPVMNFMAVCVMNFVRRKFSIPCERLLTGLLLLTAATALTLYLLPLNATGGFLALMILASVLMAAANPVLTSFIPFLYARYRYVSVVAGSIDFSIYLGSAISGYIIGGIGDRAATIEHAVHGISVFWLIAALISSATGIALSILLERRKKNHIDDGRAFE